MEEKKVRKTKYRKMHRKGEPRFKTQKKKSEEVTPTFYFKEKASTYLKYLRVVRKYIQKKYELKLSELELILFLYDEKIFDKKGFNDYACVLGFTTFDWFDKLMEREIIKSWKDERGYKTLYTLTQKYKIACSRFYKHLEGEPVPTTVHQNPLFSINASFSDKMYARLIRKMNASISEAKKKEML
jgi:hypothetical protein